MDKTRKLRRYLKKDYTQVVDFPVEIVGRDGVVRRYTFEASVRLYQRRIVSAPTRYEDNEVIEAEVRHCRRRIEQLRHSYYKRFGWTNLESGESEKGLFEVAGEYAGEVAAFLRRLYGDGDEIELLDVEWIDQDDHHLVFFIRQQDTDRSSLLFLYRFESHGACEPRERFFELLRSVQAATGEGVERLLAFHHTADCGLVLTGTGAPGIAAPGLDEHANAEEIDQYLLGRSWDDPFEAGLRALGGGHSEEALAYFERTLKKNPLHRRAYVAAAVVADSLGQLENAELLARMGLHSFPDDPVIFYHLGLARFRQGDFTGSREALESALSRTPDMFPARFLLASLLLAESRYAEARVAFEAASDCARPEDSEALQFVEQLERHLSLRRLGFGTSAALLAGGVVLLFLHLPLGLLTLGVAAAVMAVSFLSFRRSLAQLLSGDGARSFRLAPPENPAVAAVQEKRARVV